MGAITLAKAQEMLDACLEAELATLKSQEYQMLDRSNQRAKLEQVRANTKYWEQRVDAITAGRTAPVVKRAVPRDI